MGVEQNCRTCHAKKLLADSTQNRIYFKLASRVQQNPGTKQSTGAAGCVTLTKKSITATTVIANVRR